MKKSEFIYFSSMSLVPIGLINYANFNPFNIIILLIYIINLPFAIRLTYSNRHQDTIASKVMMLVLITIIISYISMVINRGKYLDWSVLYCLNFFLFWVIIKEIKTFEDIHKLFWKLLIFTIIAVLWLVYFFINPSILNSTFLDIRMGSFRGDDEGLTRIFTPGMDYIAYAMVFVLCSLFVGIPKNKTKLIILFFICLGSIVIITSTRTHLVALFITIVIIGIIKFKELKLIRLLTIPILALALYFVLPSALQNYIDIRISPLFKIYNIQLVDAIFDTVDYGGQDHDSFGTVYWRLMEIPYVISLIQQPHEIFFGKIGYLYEFKGLNEAPMPHTNFTAFYYLFGLLGVISFGIFIIYFSTKFIKINIMYRGHPKQYLAVFALSIWTNIMLLNGAAFYSPIVIGACSLIIVLEKLIENDQPLLS